MSTELRSFLHSQDRQYPPGKLADLKGGATSDPGYPQPQAAEVESARLLANDARQALLAAGLSDVAIDRLPTTSSPRIAVRRPSASSTGPSGFHRTAARRAAGAAPGTRRRCIS
jgi:hypothetical protein